MTPYFNSIPLCKETLGKPTNILCHVMTHSIVPTTDSLKKIDAFSVIIYNLLDLIQSLLQVIKNIVDVLCSDTQSDCRRCDVLLSQLFW